MDINAGAYVDGSLTMDQLGENTFEYIVAAASGQQTCGERAGHHQVQIWRDWIRVAGDDDDAGEKQVPDGVTGDPGPTAYRQFTDANHPDANRSGVPLKLAESMSELDLEVPSPLRDAALSMYPTSWNNEQTFASGRIGMICPTSLCSSHVSVSAALPFWLTPTPAAVF
jgi:hypothetical protein